MNAHQVPQEAPTPFVFSSPEGFALCRRILREYLSFDPHDVQIEGVCKVLDGVDLLAILATGTGKTSFLSMYMLVILAINNDPSLCPSAKFPENPCMLVICPTKYLEHQMVCQFIKLYILYVYQSTGECHG
jgi:superfamily II DNA or RNA helicase